MKKLLFLLSVALFTSTALHAAFTPAAFTVSAEGKQVLFSQGNLQCSGLTTNDTVWSFAKNQYDMLGTANVSGGNLADKIDLFGWSGSTGSAKWGISTSTSNAAYSGNFVDWGQNTIGTNVPNTYRTLTYDEWNYLLNTRTDAANKKGVARIKLNDGTQYANGLILLPDSWNCPEDITFKSGFADNYSEEAYTQNNIYTTEQWQQLEAAGAVFLPASGYRIGSGVRYVQCYGFYWSAAPFDTDYADCLRSYSGGAYTSYNLRYYGQAVRLVQDIKYTLTLTQPEHGTLVADKTKAVAGETVTLTITPAAYSTLKSFSVLQGDTSVTTTAVADTTNQYTFTMPAGEVTVSAEFEKVASAFTPKAFTVSAEGKQVLFSQGNLQCSGLTTNDTTWSFAEYQTEMIGADNMSSGGALADTIDLFGWSGSTGAAKWGISTSLSVSDYAGDFADWGQNIGDGTTYRTLTYEEWKYLLATRTNASEKYGVARIVLSDTEYANGLIIIPDDWNGPADVKFQSGLSGVHSEQAYADYQTFTLAQWQQLEAAGAVFLPASGYRQGVGIYGLQDLGYYWSATVYSWQSAYYPSFYSHYMDLHSLSYRYDGRSVRLVQDIKYTLTLTQPEHGTIAADKTEAVAGDKVTLTITPNAYYSLKTVTVMQGKTPITTTAVDGTTNQYTFTMPAGEVIVSAVFEKVASAFTPAAFTVSAEGKQVYFSQGNLQCSGLTTNDTTWSFAEYQTEMIGADNMSGGTEQYDDNYGYSKSGDALADKIDLFGWSGSMGAAKWGIGTSRSNADYAGNFVDWGQNIGDGTTYRTLTYDEWDYLLNTRTNADEKRSVARIKLSETEYANGLILLPDSLTCPADVKFTSGFARSYSIEAYATHQTFTLAQWQQLEAAGAVFLPASGYRDGSYVYGVQNYGRYWSATPDEPNSAYDLSFYLDGAGAGDDSRRSCGRAVRLVQDVYAVNIAATTNGTVAADKTMAPAGEMVTLTIAPAAYYSLKTITVLQGETPVTTTAVEDPTNQYTFTMPQGEVIVSAEFEKVASAFTPAAFTITASGKKVYFSSGNLQCSGLTTNDTTWSFAEYQTEVIGTANMSGGTEQYEDYYGYSKSGDAIADKIDLFGWSGSTGAAKWGISTSTSNTDYSGDFADWGQKIGDGTTYRTLTYDEWGYLLNTRTNADEKRGVARIKLSETEYANGLILLPDSWTCPGDITFKSGYANEDSEQAYADYQTFTLSDWQQLEAAGAVFLPASGYRYGSGVYNVRYYGRYWSATPVDTDYALYLSFYSCGAYTGYYGRCYGRAVRLVQDVYAVNIAATTNGTVAADKTEAVAGDEVTLTITPDTGYELDVLTVQDAAGNPVTVNDNTFTMPASNVTVSATFKQSPQTAIGNTTDAADTTVRKILIDGQVYILRDNKTYTTTGIEVRP